MKTIDITTAQNVTIEHQLAAVGDRIFAFIIDFLIIVLGIVFLRLIFVSIFAEPFHKFAEYFISVPIFLFYTPASEMLSHGRTIGKIAVGLKVVKLNGQEVGFTDYLIRWTFRMVDIYFSLGSVATLLVSSTEKAQRWGDMLANTIVVRAKPKYSVQLKSILSMQSIENYSPRYPEVKNMTEKDMLLVKETLERMKRHPNSAHQAAAENLAKVICAHLHITNEYTQTDTFLRTLINDYIVLTR